MPEQIDAEVIQVAVRPGLLRRLAAMFYDAWLVAAFWLIGVIADLAVRHLLGLDTAGAHPLLQLYLIAVPFAFFGWFWIHGGQTLGMRAWRLKLLARDGASPSWGQAAVRYVGAIVSAAALGLGYLWILVDRDRLAWHDRLSGTLLVLVKR